MTDGIANFIIGALSIVFGVLLLIPTLRKHRNIDTESVAVVKEVLDLGMDEGRKVYAIKYMVQASEPFELLVSPCKKKLRPGVERSVFYEKENSNINYYFKTVGQFDSRLVVPCSMVAVGVLIAVLGLITMIFGT